MKQLIDINNWSRKELYQFFRQFEEPFFGVCVSVNCTHAYQQAKKSNQSFFLSYLHKALKAANQVENFRYRIQGDSVYLYEQVNASPTINRTDGSFGFGYMDYHSEFDVFERNATSEIEKVQNSKGIVPAVSGENLIHFSSLPWINFTAVSHARSFSFRDSIPKISFGKMTSNADGICSMPVSVHVHHALADGFHVSEFLRLFETYMNE